MGKTKTKKHDSGILPYMKTFNLKGINQTMPAVTSVG